jgi:hypothetical protein
MRIAEYLLLLLDGWDGGKFSAGNFVKDSVFPYEDEKKAYNRPNIYHSGAEMDLFVQGSTQQLSRIYHYLWITGAPTDGFSCALDLKIKRGENKYGKQA